MKRTSSTSQKVLALLSPSKETMNLEMKKALDLLNLRSFDDLEQRFLSCAAFLEPWVSFRDSFLLLQKGGMVRSTLPGQIEGPALLTYYTQYDEGQLRYDPRADETSSMYDGDLETDKYGMIDKRTWGVVEYEKLLYAWLLQAWKVGKKNNPGDFKYFVYKNQVTAWREVFVPIVNAVRDSYDIKGRRHYGRLAMFVEGIAPSRLAFPENNVGVGIEPGMVVPPTTPYRVISRPLVEENRAEGSGILRATTIKKKHYDDTEKELRNAFPGFGQLVERPKNMKIVKDFLEAQRQKKEIEKTRRMLEGLPPLEESVSTSLMKRISTSPFFRRSSLLRNSAHKKNSSSEPPSPFPGIELFEISRTPTKMATRSPYGEDNDIQTHDDRTISMESSNTVWPSQSVSQKRGYDPVGHAGSSSGSVSTPFRTSNRYGTPDRQRADYVPSFASEEEESYPLTPIPRSRIASTLTTDTISEYAPSAIPRALFSQGNIEQSTPSGKYSGSRRVSPAMAYDPQQISRSKESERIANRSSIRPPSSLLAYLNQPSTIPEETSHVRSPSDEASGRINPALRESSLTGESTMLYSSGFPNAYEESVHPALRSTSRATKPAVTRIPSPAAAYDGREYGSPYGEQPRPGAVSKNRVHTPVAEFDEPQYIKQDGTTRAGQPTVTRIPTALYQYLNQEDNMEEEPFYLDAPPKGHQQVAKAKSDADLFPLNEAAPPIPLKSPRRINSVQSGHSAASHPRQNQMASKSSHNLVAPAVSIDNIRAALGSPSRSSSEEEEVAQQQSRATSGSGSLTRRAGGHSGGPLRTYNTHMFPRHRSQESSPGQDQGTGAAKDPK